MRRLTALIILLVLLLPQGCSNTRGTVSAVAGSGQNAVRLPIIMYHHITQTPSRVNDYTVLLSEFENDLKYIKDNGFKTVKTADILGDISLLPEKPIMITFDDGFESTYQYAYPLLKKYEMCAVLSVVGEYADRYTLNPDHNVRYSCCDWNEIDEMDDSGVIEIQCHTDALHGIKNARKGCARKKGESEQEYHDMLLDDLKKFQQKMTDCTGHAANAIAYPYGSHSNTTAGIAREAGIEAAFTCEEKVNFIGGGTDWQFSLGRFNRKGKYTNNEMFVKINKE